jgi:hypothetical protein
MEYRCHDRTLRCVTARFRHPIPDQRFIRICCRLRCFGEPILPFENVVSIRSRDHLPLRGIRKGFMCGIYPCVGPEGLYVWLSTVPPWAAYYVRRHPIECVEECRCNSDVEAGHHERRHPVECIEECQCNRDAKTGSYELRHPIECVKECQCNSHAEADASVGL